MSTLTRLALLDGELLRLGKRKGELETEVLKIRKQLGAEEARYLKLSGELLSVRTKVDSASRQLEEERAQFSERQKRIHSGVGGQTLKSLEGENDRSMIVMDAAEKELGKLKQELSEIESETKSAEALLTERKVALTRQEH